AGREHRVLGGGDERHSFRLDVVAPTGPRLECDLVPARDKALAEREHRERVAGVAERAQKDPQPVGHPASSATARSCAIRSSAANAIGEIVRVPTPASRNAAMRSRTTSRGPASETMS